MELGVFAYLEPVDVDDLMDNLKVKGFCRRGKKENISQKTSSHSAIFLI
jgi:hypothetical protein